MHKCVNSKTQTVMDLSIGRTLFYFIFVFVSLMFCVESQYTPQGCYTDRSSTSMTFIYSGGSFPEMTPYLCYLKCLEMDIVIPGRPLTIGITEGTVCLCGYEFLYNDTENLALASSFCPMTCNDTSPCGGLNGAVSVYTNFNVYATNNLTVTTVDFNGINVSSVLELNTLSTGEIMHIIVQIGQHPCYSYLPCLTAPLPGVRNCTKSTTAPTQFDCSFNGVLPPINITVDYGDGSGSYLWNREDRQDVWSHIYSEPGVYTISVQVINVYSQVFMSTSNQVRVVEPANDWDQSEIICPAVINPGDFFVCKIDIPYGNDLVATVTLADDIYYVANITTGPMFVPNAFHNTPGGPIRYKSYNSTNGFNSAASGYTAFVLNQSYFQNVANITRIEFVPLSRGSLIIELLKPICPVKTVWCPLIGKCSNRCNSLLEMQTGSNASTYSCGVALNTHFCSQEETCFTPLSCPSFTTSAASWNVAPTTYNATFTIWSGTILDAEKLMKKTIVINKALLLGALTDYSQAYVGFKTNLEVPYSGASFIGFRCAVAPCANIPYDLIPLATTDSKGDSGATYSGGFYNVGNGTLLPPRKYAVRVRLQEDRVMAVKQKFFCDKTTEKTVHLQITDLLQHNVARQTRRVSCQFPVVSAIDLTQNCTNNIQNNSWALIQDFPPQSQITLGKEKLYRTSLWVRLNEAITFWVQFPNGSHISLNWTIVDPVDPLENCTTMAGTAPAGGMLDGATFYTTTGKPCIFPFRYDKILYYGCTNFTATNMCATKVDNDYNAVELGKCNAMCHIQSVRADESATPTDTTVDIEAFVETQNTFLLSKSTDLQLTRTFKKTGVIYKVLLVAYNLNNKTDVMKMQWDVICANPILPADWSISYSPYLRPTETFNFTLSIKASANLPTRPTLRIAAVNGMQRIDNDIEIDNQTDIWFAIKDGTSPIPNCFNDTDKCFKTYNLQDLGIGTLMTATSTGALGGIYGTNFTVYLPTIKGPGSHGFSVQFVNGISSIKYNHSTMIPYTETIEVLDPGYLGTGEWVAITAPKWDLNWVEMYQMIEEPVLPKFGYYLPLEYDSKWFGSEYVSATRKWYVPADGQPAIYASIYAGTVRRIQYTFNNTAAGGYQPPPCFIDWPEGTLTGTTEWVIGHCPNMTEDTYMVTLSAWNPIDGWISSKPTLVEILSSIGPITINDFSIINDANETKPFTITLGKAGRKSCIAINFGDGTPVQYYGYYQSCQLRNSLLLPSVVKPFNYDTKTFDLEHVYTKRGLYPMLVYGFDERYYAEASLDLTIFKSNCMAPVVWIPKNQTSFAVWEAIPMIWKSKPFQIAASASIVCNVTTATYISWKVYSVALVSDPDSQVGKKEVLTPIRINDTIPSWTQGVLDVPPLIFDYGLHKFVFRFQVETGSPDIPMFREAYTYVNITKSELQPILIKGSVAKVTRGWGQMLILSPQDLSLDPDNLDDKNFNYTWWCRIVSPTVEKYPNVDSQGFPIYNDNEAQFIPRPGDPVLINPGPGCFGLGPGPLKTRSGIIFLNTASLVTYSRVYEIMLILSKDTRQSKVKIELDLGSIPAPIAEIQCASEGLCFPAFGGVWVNPTSRLALKGECLSVCDGILSYYWEVYEEPLATSNLNFSYCGSDVALTTPISAPVTPATIASVTTTAPYQVAQYQSILTTDGNRQIASTIDIFDYGNSYFKSADPDTESAICTTISGGSKRRKRATVANELDTIGPIGPPLPSGCNYVFADGTRDARDGKQLSIQQPFFDIQHAKFKTFVIKMNITKKVYDGRKFSYASGISYLNVFINSPPDFGTCEIKVGRENNTWELANSGRGLIDIFQILCSGFKDPNQHAIVKYVFKITEVTEGGNQTTMLYAGPLPASGVVLPVGEFDLYVEIYDEANAYGIYRINPKFLVYLPTEKDYKNFNLAAELEKATKIGDQARISQLLQADASIRSTACWFNLTCTMAQMNLQVDFSKYPDGMDDLTLNQVNDLLINITNANTDALTSAVDNMQFNNIDQLQQGASVLYAITSNIAGDGLMSKTLDMKGRTEAVALMNKMADGFDGINVPDPNKLKPFIEAVTGSVMAIMESLNSILYSNDPNQIPLTDFAAAADLPYDTYIPEGGADIPEDPAQALRDNAMSLTRIQAVQQCQQMTQLVDKIAQSALKNSVVGEVLKTKAPLGVQMIMTKLDGASTVGADLNGDGKPDRPLRYEFDSTDPKLQSIIQFPLGFCPGNNDLSNPNIKPENCTGQWGFVFKEWETITAIYPPSAVNLNYVSKQMDVDVYSDDGSTRIDVHGMKVNIEIILGRMKVKNPAMVTMTPNVVTTVVVSARTDALKTRKKPPIIYHKVPVPRPYSAFKVQMKVDNNATSTMIILLRHAKLPTAKACDMVKVVRNITNVEDTLHDWFVTKEFVNNRTGFFYLGVASIKMADIKVPVPITDESTCADSGIDKQELDWDFHTTNYSIQVYTVGLYYLDNATTVWEGKGITVFNTTKTLTGAGTNHLTSFVTGMMPQVNTIDFDFIFATVSVADNMTIFMLIIVTFLIYLCTMIWAILKDKKDLIAVAVPCMADNHPDDKYFYEIVVETGPKDSHATTANIHFILAGNDEETDVRVFNDPERELFKKGARDAFICSVPRPLGELNYLRVWTDSCALGEMSAWYLMCVTVHDVQTGKVTRFVADQWLAIDRGTFEDDVTLSPQDEDEPFTPSYVFRSGGNRKLADDHLWWSVYSRPVRSRFTRCQRVSVCMALLYLSFLVNAMFYDGSEPRITDPLFTIGLFGFDQVDIIIGFISNLIVFPPILLIVYLFKKSKPLKKRENRLDKGLELGKEKGRFNYSLDDGHVKEPTEYDIARERGWPSYCRIVGWIVCALTILGGAFIVLSYGLQFGNEMTYQWVVSMLISFFSSLIITQPIKIAVIALIIGYCCKKTDFDDDHVFQEEVLPTVFFDPENPPNLVDRPKAKAAKRMLEPEFYDNLKTRKLIEQEMKELLRNMVVYFVYVSIVFIICYGNRDPNAYREKLALQKAIIFGGTHCQTVPDDDPAYFPCNQWGGVDLVDDPFVNYLRITSMNAWWNWLEKTVMTNVRVQEWYNGDSPYGLRGYLDDRVNRIIGYAIVRQIREKPGNCKPAKVVRSQIPKCTGEDGISNEDSNNYCRKWAPKMAYNEKSSDCIDASEYAYRTADILNSSTTSAGIRNYGGGGYVFKLTGYNNTLQNNLQRLKLEEWADNRTRALILEFSVYNAQTNLFAMVSCVAEFAGGGIKPWYRIDAVSLFNDYKGWNKIVLFCEIMFVVSTFYYLVNMLAVLKKEGCNEFWSNNWNLADCFTVLLSITAVGLYVARLLMVGEVTKIINATRGNEYISLYSAFQVNSYYTYVISFTVFTSTIKLSKFLSFQKAFMQIAATIRLCFSGLATFVVEFSIVFFGFSAFFFFVLKDSMEDFRDFIRAVENTMAMSIGKFNFASLKAADEMAAWIFFVFAIVVNMILINMMMAIINLSFEEIKNNNEQYKNKFELLDYFKRSVKEMIGVLVAEPIVPVYLDESDSKSNKRKSISDGGDSDPNADKVSKDFTEKTDMLLDYIERTYLADGFADSEEGRRIIAKMSKPKVGGQGQDSKDEKKVMEIGFDAIFQNNTDDQ